jgi:hypothetical protein
VAQLKPCPPGKQKNYTYLSIPLPLNCTVGSRRVATQQTSIFRCIAALAFDALKFDHRAVAMENLKLAIRRSATPIVHWLARSLGAAKTFQCKCVGTERGRQLIADFTS